MTMQFLASVRRNQKQWMVVVTILAIFAFLFDDVVRGANNLSPASMALFFAVLCGGGMSIIGYSRQHTVLYGAIGFVAGGGAALIGSSFAGPKPLVRTNAGNLTIQKIVQLRNDRTKVQRFLRDAVERATKRGGGHMFGDLSENSMVEFAVLHHEAKRLGVSVSDEGINRFIQAETQEMMSRKDYLEALKDAGISESEMFELLRAELEVQLVRQLTSPPANFSPAIAQTNMFNQYIGRPQLPNRMALMTPEYQWQNFRKLNVRQSLTAIAIPVTEFVKQVPEPSDTELREYFDKRKSFVGDDQGNPGFLELEKVKLGYLMASNLEAYENLATKPTDQEIVDYYDKHKEEFRIREIPDFPDFKLPNLKGSESVNPDAPADALIPTNAAESTPAPSDPPTVEKPAPEKSSGEPSDKKEPEKKPDGTPNPPKDPTKDEPKCDDDAATKKAAADEAAKPAAEAELPKPVAEKGSETPPAPALPTTDSADHPPTPNHPKTGPLMPPHLGPLAPPKYRDLDADLKQEIEAKLLMSKAFAKMGEAADDANVFMLDLNQKYSEANKSERETLAETFAAECKKFAEKKGLEYHETKAMTYRELASSLDEPIGMAMEPVSERNPRRNIPPVADLIFAKLGKNYRIPLYSPQRADSSKAKYAYWKIAEIPSRIPELTNETTRQLVVDSWKYEKARFLAEKRAKDVAELAKKSPTDIAGALSGQTINGSAESPALTIRETPKFSWLRVTPSVPTMGQAIPTESFIDGVDQPGSDFMKLIFEQLGEGDVGVGLNRSKTAFYVVRVHDRDGSTNDGGVALQELQQQFLKEHFTSHMITPYDYLALEAQHFVDKRWRQNFNKRFGITYEGNGSQETEDE